MREPGNQDVRPTNVTDTLVASGAIMPGALRAPGTAHPAASGTARAEWSADCGLEKHMAIVGYLKSEHGMGHGHASALVGWTLAGNVASS